MRFFLGAALGLISSTLVVAQTYTDCNPTKKTCPADPAFGQSDKTFDFTSGASDAFKSTGSVTYDSTNGATFTISKQGDGPLIQSGWYIMFGRVECTIKAAAGTGIVSSAVLQSDDLDEIDWEWLGGNNAQVQTNYFGKGDTTSYSRGAYHDNAGNHDEFHTFSIDWTSTQIVWAIDGKTVRVLTPETADTNQYPQSPMMIKVGVWAGGDSNNAQGTIDWAGGETDYTQGPFKMYLKSMTVTDYSTGTSYKYGDTSGSWESIVAEGGKVNGNKAAEPTSTESAPLITATVDSVPVPWSGTHKETTSWVTPNVWPWVASDSPSASSTGSQYDWESGSGQNKPPGGDSMIYLPLYWPSSFSSSRDSGMHLDEVMVKVSPDRRQMYADLMKVATVKTYSQKTEAVVQPALENLVFPNLHTLYLALVFRGWSTEESIRAPALNMPNLRTLYIERWNAPIQLFPHHWDYLTGRIPKLFPRLLNLRVEIPAIIYIAGFEALSEKLPNLESIEFEKIMALSEVDEDEDLFSDYSDGEDTEEDTEEDTDENSGEDSDEEDSNHENMDTEEATSESPYSGLTHSEHTYSADTSSEYTYSESIYNEYILGNDADDENGDDGDITSEYAYSEDMGEE
ncbi:CAZyme family GH16 [Penicillium roqueforti]|uniref:CAZyme family GH16 n=1 Tax=Penicillium roqueforti TaxID=5082 RepID=UPI00190AE478|nr:CAZyme family GH16 [Penicillium roqueforti]KAF9248039.1 CAZyme family GH16 [Penicillium roqueforti]